MAFASHLRLRAMAQTRRFAAALADIDDLRRAEALRGFVDRGEHTVPAPWWSPGARCFVGLHLPVDYARGDLWFDPVEASFFLALPWMRAPREPGVVYPDRPQRKWFGWLAIEPVAQWQMRGASSLDLAIPQTHSGATAAGASHFSTLVGKSVCGSVFWNMLRRGYDDAMLRRLWSSEAEYGRGGPSTADFVVLRRAQIEGWDVNSPGVPEDVSGEERLGLHYRTAVANDVGLLAPDDGALEREWQASAR